jgi:hypothetical protein
MLVFIGGTPLGAPVIGAVTSHFGARTGMLACGVVPALAAVVVAAATVRRQRRAAAGAVIADPVTVAAAAVRV